MKPRIIGKLHQLHELNNYMNAMTPSDRSKIPVLFIDDDPFMYLEDLRNEHFNLMQINDIEDFKAVEYYPVVICDIKGVGHKFSKDKEGAYVVETIKKLYPFKQVAVYSSGNYGIDTLSGLQGVETIKKDVDKDMWSSYIETLISKASNPILIWKNIRSYLLKQDVSIKEVMLLESEYVNLVLNNPSELRNFPNRKRFPGIKEDIRGIIQSIIGGGLLALLGV